MTSVSVSDSDLMPLVEAFVEYRRNPRLGAWKDLEGRIRREAKRQRTSYSTALARVHQLAETRLALPGTAERSVTSLA